MLICVSIRRQSSYRRNSWLANDFVFPSISPSLFFASKKSCWATVTTTTTTTRDSYDIKRSYASVTRIFIAGSSSERKYEHKSNHDQVTKTETTTDHTQTTQRYLGRRRRNAAWPPRSSQHSARRTSPWWRHKQFPMTSMTSTTSDAGSRTPTFPLSRTPTMRIPWTLRAITHMQRQKKDSFLQLTYTPYLLKEPSTQSNNS